MVSMSSSVGKGLENTAPYPARSASRRLSKEGWAVMAIPGVLPP